MDWLNSHATSKCCENVSAQLLTNSTLRPVQKSTNPDSTSSEEKPVPTVRHRMIRLKNHDPLFQVRPSDFFLVLLSTKEQDIALSIFKLLLMSYIFYKENNNTS